jgi:hypothetical protein
MAQLPAVSNEKNMLSENMKYSKLVMHNCPPPQKRTWTKYKKLSLVLQILCFALGVSFLTPFGRMIFTLGYKAMHTGDKAHNHTLCSEEVGTDGSTYIAAQPAGSKALKPRDWVVNCSSSIADHGCDLAYDDKGKKTYWQSSDNPPVGGHSVLIDLKREFYVHSLMVNSKEDWKSGGTPYKHRVEVRTANVNWTTVAVGTWRNYSEGVYR